MDIIKVGKNISELRKKKGLTQQELGDKLFVTDKAVSKWERGLSLPDISILEKLADILDTDIYNILQIQKKKNLNLEEIVQNERIKIKKQFRNKIFYSSLIIIIIIFIILFKLYPFGYTIKHEIYNYNDNKIIDLGVPKFSFFMQNIEDSYSYKSFRSRYVLLSEAKDYVNKLEHINCKNTTYYYDPVSDITIIDYSVTSNLLYNTINYHIKNGQYCNTYQYEKYKEKTSFKTYQYKSDNIELYFSIYGDIEGKNTYNANLVVTAKDKNNNDETIEISNGTYTIENNILTYNRKTLAKTSENIKVPQESTFTIDGISLVLNDNYLAKYSDSIILK